MTLPPKKIKELSEIPGGDHLTSALSALSAVAQSQQISLENMRPPVSAGRLALQIITSAVQITFLQDVNILELLIFSEIFQVF